MSQLRTLRFHSDPLEVDLAEAKKIRAELETGDICALGSKIATLIRRSFAHIDRDFSEPALAHLVDLVNLREVEHRSIGGLLSETKSVSREEIMRAYMFNPSIVGSALEMGLKGDWEPMKHVVDQMQRGYAVHPEQLFKSDFLHAEIGLSRTHGDLMRPVSERKKLTEAEIVKHLTTAAIWHADQRRKDKARTPYIVHLGGALQAALECGEKDEVALVAICYHDSVEDVKKTRHDIERVAGKEVAAVVMECTDDKLKSKIARKRLQLEHASEASDSAKRVKGYDALNNLESLVHSPPNWKPEEMTGYAVWCYAKFLKIRGLNAKLDARLEQVFAKLLVKLPSEEELPALLEQYYKCIDKSE